VYQEKSIAFIAVVHMHMTAIYYRVTRLVVFPDYQGIGVGKRLLNFIAELYTSQTKVPFHILTSNPPDNTWKHEELENDEVWTCKQRTGKYENKQ